MTPPFVARALVAAATSPIDYESVAGDLYEEYTGRVVSTGRASADRWYWSQVFRSIPALLSYSRSTHSLAGNTITAAIVVFVLFAMLFSKDFVVDPLIDALSRGAHAWQYFLFDWLDAAVFGALLSALRPLQGLRLVIIASLGLVTAFALPIILGLSAKLGPLAWLLLLGAIPAMSLGAAISCGLRKR